MGKKYIIELPENTHWIQWIMEGTKDHHPYMDFKQVEDLTPYAAPDLEQVRKEAYQQGYEQGYKDGYNEPGKGKIQIGDEVERILNGEVDSKAVFLEDNEGYYYCLFWTGYCFTTLSYPKEQFRKTGRHFDEFAIVLEKMREESNG